MARAAFDGGRLVEAFGHLGRDLASRGVFLELAVYGGSAIMLHYIWRKGTEGVDAVLRPGSDERLLAPSAARVAALMGLPDDWINDAVGMFTPLVEDDALFDLSGVYPDIGVPGLRVLVAKPHYLRAMKLMALSNLDRGDRDMDDARMLARELRIGDVEALQRLYASIHGEQPAAELLASFASVLA
ncbi:hypothetical protein [Lichenibacterium dinghuense]|uniref:hypothetical protein n=1 Tax=Lichenibacterium dinghuense TaxID=2895977 RepID=UPI001F47CF2F|nr:hypothetical protein [Lichenibacterium sp. 6Y81]